MAELTRINVNLTAAAADALDRLCIQRDENRTDVINRAVRLLDWFTETAEQGRLRVVNANGEQETVVIL